MMLPHGSTVEALGAWAAPQHRWPTRTLTWSCGPRLTGYWAAKGVPLAAWVRELRYALLDWSHVAGFAFIQVADSATDEVNIRFGAAPMEGAVGVTSWRAHDYIEHAAVIFSTTYDFGLVVNPPLYDEQTVALHEAGHALGLGHSADPESVMYPIYQGRRTQPTPADIAIIEALYRGVK